MYAVASVYSFSLIYALGFALSRSFCPGFKIQVPCFQLSVSRPCRRPKIQLELVDLHAEIVNLAKGRTASSLESILSHLHILDCGVYHEPYNFRLQCIYVKVTVGSRISRVCRF